MPPSQNGMVNNWPQGFHGIFVVSNFVAFFITMTTDIFCKLTKIIFSVFSILCLKWEVLGIYYSKSTFEQKSSWSKVVSSILIHLEKYWEIDISYSLKRTIFKFKRWRTKRSNEVSFFLRCLQEETETDTKGFCSGSVHGQRCSLKFC